MAVNCHANVSNVIGSAGITRKNWEKSPTRTGGNLLSPEEGCKLYTRTPGTISSGDTASTQFSATVLWLRWAGALGARGGATQAAELPDFLAEGYVRTKSSGKGKVP